MVLVIKNSPQNAGDIRDPGSMHETGCSGPVHWDDPEGWDGKGGGREGQDGDTLHHG